MKRAGFSQKSIAIELKVSAATISRELKRNSTTQMKSYSANNAHKVATTRRMYASRKSNKKIDNELKRTITNYLMQDWSSEHIRNYSQFRLNQSSDGTDPITPKLKF